MKKIVTWVLIADGHRARVLQNDGPGKGFFLPLKHECIGVNTPTRDMVSDRQGRSFDSKGQGRHAMEPQTDPHRYEKLRFAKQVSEELDSYQKKSAFDRLVIVAAPQTLGDLRNELSAALKAVILAEVPKDLTKTPLQEISVHLADVLAA